jgi:Zn-dependent M28 family amino/carboxypeptidase
MLSKYKALLIVSTALVAIGLYFVYSTAVSATPEFDGNRAFEDIEYQLSLGPRIPGTTGHAQIVDWLIQSLRSSGWQVNVQETQWEGKPIRNIIAKLGKGDPWIILGAHYDTRIFADQDTDSNLKDDPVPGANDGASGVAVLVELARVIPRSIDKEIWLVFFDAEDNGRIEDWDWILGSRAFVASLNDYPEEVVIVDMIGDEDLQIYYESNSDVTLREEIWSQARLLSYENVFIQEVRHSMLDDHTPFLEAGIPAVDIIDFDYPYWHTTNDTLDKVSAESLRAVGETLLAWVISH